MFSFIDVQFIGFKPLTDLVQLHIYSGENGSYVTREIEQICVVREHYTV